MLVLNRKLEESLIIGEGENRIVMKVIKIKRGRVVLGFEGNRAVSVLRGEVQERTKGEASENVGAAS